MATHINTSNPHNHYLINPINLLTGRKFSESIKDMLLFREKINNILNRHGLKKIGLSDTFSEEIDDGLPLSEESELSESDILKDMGQGTQMFMEIINFPQILKQEPIKPFVTKDTPLVKPFTVNAGKKPFTIQID